MAGNPWKRLKGLLADDPTEIGTVQTQNSNGTSVVSLVGGGLITVTGTGYAPGQRVFTKGGAIVSGAPALPAVEIEV